ncbi:MAG: hypothetical protein ACRC3Z_08405 [Phocaeicola sp.]
MKLLIRNTIVILLTLLVTYGGAGINLFTYCCNDCRTGGVSVILEEKCCDVHEHSHTSQTKAQAHTACGSSCRIAHPEPMLQSPEEEACDISRIDTQWEYAQVSPIELEPMAMTLPPFLVAQLMTLVEPPVERLCTTNCDHGPPVQPPRTYLSRLTTLLI